MGVKEARTYTAAERWRAVLRAGEVGAVAAAHELGLPKGTVSCWAHLARKAGAGATAGLPAWVREKPPAPEESSGRAPAGTQSTAAGASVSEPPKAVVSEETREPTNAAASTSAPTGRRVARVYTPSERARALELADEIGVTKASRQLGISRFSIQEWRRKVRLHAAGKAQTSPVVGPDAPPGEERDHRILTVWRAHPGLGPSQVRNQLRRDGFKVSVHTVRVVLEEHGYVAPKVRRREVHDQRYEAIRPNQLWHTDFLQRFIHKQSVYTLLLLDDFSRFIVGWAMWDAERADAIIGAFERAAGRYGRPEMMMSDGGSAFRSWRGISRFTRVLEEYGVDQLIAKKAPTNGKLEVLNANVQKELFNVERFFDLGEAQRRLETWISFYNFRRTHHALGGLLVPADRYFGRADEVLAAIEAGRPHDGIAEPAPLGERLLDLFRVSSHGGELALHLMGQRLWPPATPGR
jgi:transposase InsO family protein